MCNVQCAMYNVQCTMCNVQLLQRQGSQQPFMLNNLTNCRQCLYADGRDKRCNFRQYTA